jgi:hypothetical protein
MARSRRATVGLFAIALGFASSSWTADGAPRNVITYRSDRLSVRLTAVPLEEVMTDLGQTTGAAVYGTVREPRDVSAVFDEVPLVEALHRLLGDQNFVVKYGQGGRPRAIKLLGGPQAPIKTVATSAPATPAPAASGGPPEPSGAVAMLDRHRPVPVSGQLAQALGTDAATFRELFDAASRNEDAAVRAEAMGAFIGALDAEPEFRDPVLRAINTLDDLTLTELLRGLAGSRAEEIAAQIAARAHVSELSSRAWGILLRLGGSQGTANPPGTRPAT